MWRPLRSSESFCASIAEVMPPPMMQTSVSWVGIVGRSPSTAERLAGPTPLFELRRGLAGAPRAKAEATRRREEMEESVVIRSSQRLRPACRDRDRPAHLALNQGAVAVVVRLAAAEIERHQIDDDVLARRPRRKRPDAGGGEHLVQHRAAGSAVEAAPAASG